MIGSTLSIASPVYLRLLGPVHLEGAEGPLPGRAVELLAYLHLHPYPVPGVQMQHDFWPEVRSPHNDHTRTLARQARHALGHAPDGRLWLPEASREGYRLHPALRSDWGDFQRLIGTDPVAASSEALVDALRLVTGSALDGATRRRGWWLWREPFEETITAAVIAAAAVLFSRAIDTPHLAAARTAARIAYSADPLDETGWRMRLALARACRDDAGYARTLADLYRVIGPLDTLDPHTRRLIGE